MPDFNTPAVIREKRISTWGIQYVVVNGFPRNVSVRWYYLRDVRLVRKRSESHQFIGQRSGRMPSDHERYLEPVVAPLQAKQRLDSLESWQEYEQYGFSNGGRGPR